MPTLESERLYLRPLEESDVDALFEIFSDREVTRFWSSEPLHSLSDAHDLLAQIHAGFRDQRFFQWGIVPKGEDRVVGTCTLYAWDKQHGRAELGFAIAQHRWGEGLAREAARRAVRYAFEELDIRRLEADTDPRNIASLRILEGLGFQREGYMRQRYFLNGERQDAIFLALLRPEFESAS